MALQLQILLLLLARPVLGNHSISYVCLGVDHASCLQYPAATLARLWPNQDVRRAVALRLHLMAAAAGDAEAFMALGDAFAQGAGGYPRDAGRALWWYGRASTAGFARGVVALGALVLALIALELRAARRRRQRHLGAAPAR
eukprot:TRINITY_DN2235_c0_g1_i2.p3 TRINITY_DN2235_c0_g1~~TRINITY_DN2235_c0_g1_i2.p3  ORF type:complete len:142 (-),score=40.73 TRINITY_DN2235_c0_g1_i2:510-935(-)